MNKQFAHQEAIEKFKESLKAVETKMDSITEKLTSNWSHYMPMYASEIHACDLVVKRLSAYIEYLSSEDHRVKDIEEYLNSVIKSEIERALTVKLSSSTSLYRVMEYDANCKHYNQLCNHLMGAIPNGCKLTEENKTLYRLLKR